MRRENFYGDGAVEPCITCPIHLTQPTSAERRLNFIGTEFRARGDKVKPFSPHHRLMIAWRSPDELIETGLHVCPPEKKAAKLTCGVKRDTFSGPV